MIKIKKVVMDDLYETIHGYISERDIEVNEYSDMIEAILRMIKEGYCFSVDRDILRDAMETLTYMYSPEDDMNKDRLVQQLNDDDDEDGDESDSDEGEDNFKNMDLMKMMQMMGGPLMGGMNQPTETESVEEPVPDTKVVKQE
tara:strand:- start:858 stop:1286 length:429 start_codon:yes stop_codon:yes gene_type:complete